MWLSIVVYPYSLSISLMLFVFLLFVFVAIFSLIIYRLAFIVVLKLLRTLLAELLFLSYNQPVVCYVFDHSYIVVACLFLYRDNVFVH